jgi:hypothetical protein
MALDALMTKSVTISTAGTDYPTGPVAVGGASVDEIDLYHAGKGSIAPLAAVAFVSAISGTNTLLVISLESDDNTSFSSAVARLSARGITTIGKKFLFWVSGIPERYVRFKIVSTSDTTAAATVTCALLDAEDNSYHT